MVSIVVLGGCGTAEAGAAAVVGDRRISVAQVQSAYAGILELAGPDQQITQNAILDELILAPYLVQAASELGRGVSVHDAELQFEIDSLTVKPSPAAITVMHALYASSQIQGGRSEEEYAQTYREIIERIKADGVHINPRFGSSIDLDPTSPTQLQIIPEQPNWLVTPRAAATPAP